jgi:hypothetical protein
MVINDRQQEPAVALSPCGSTIITQATMQGRVKGRNCIGALSSAAVRLSEDGKASVDLRSREDSKKPVGASQVRSATTSSAKRHLTRSDKGDKSLTAIYQ